MLMCVAEESSIDMDKMERYGANAVAVVVGLMVASLVCMAQQGGGPADPLTIRTTSLPKGYVGQKYEAQMLAHGGGAPYRWEIKEGTLPSGMNLHSEGILIGVPSEVGEFKFTVTARDSGSPAYEIQQKLVLTVVAPLFLQWGKYPVVNGGR